jgi:hypothetical protein
MPYALRYMPSVFLKYLTRWSKFDIFAPQVFYELS